MRNRMRIGRLKRWVRILEGIEKKDPALRTFDMSRWVRVHPCQTVCCALGHAALDPQFKKAGLVLDPKGEMVKAKSSEEGYFRFGSGAASYFFGITEEEAQGLTYAGFYSKTSCLITPSDVVEKIKKLIKRYECATC